MVKQPSGRPEFGGCFFFKDMGDTIKAYYEKQEDREIEQESRRLADQSKHICAVASHSAIFPLTFNYVIK